MSDTGLSVANLGSELQKNYFPKLKNFLGGDKEALKFLSAVMYTAESNPEILKCTPNSVLSAFMKCAELNLYPSSVSGEAYIIPYNNKKYDGKDSTGKAQYSSKKEAQFQLGYKGVVTLLIRSGVSGIYTAVVRKGDTYSLVNGEIQHSVDMTKSSEERGEIIGIYATAKYSSEKISHYMHISDIYKFREFSKSVFDFGTKNISKNSPWNPEKDPESWMPKKVVLVQMAKLLPKGEDVYKALFEDNKDSMISEPKRVEVGGPEATKQLEKAQAPTPVVEEGEIEPLVLNENKHE